MSKISQQAEQAPEELKKSVDKIFKDKRYVIYTEERRGTCARVEKNAVGPVSYSWSLDPRRFHCEDLSEECNDMLMEKLNLRNADELKASPLLSPRICNYDVHRGATGCLREARLPSKHRYLVAMSKTQPVFSAFAASRQRQHFTQLRTS